MKSNFLLLFSIHSAGYVFRGTQPFISSNKTRAIVRIWAWFSSEGAGSIAPIQNLSENQFLELLEEELIPKAAARFGVGPISLMDNSRSRTACPIHLFNDFKQLERTASFQELKWPPKSSHLSPFESVWQNIRKTIDLQRRQPEDEDELWDLIERTWERRSEQPLFWKGVIDQLKAKLNSIVASGGEMTETEETF